MYVPIVIVSYNNHFYVKNTVEQLLQIDPAFAQHIIVMDNNSSDTNTIDYLNEAGKDIRIVRNASNNGPWLTPHINADLYNSLPTKFILTDPDLEFNPHLPANFLDILLELSNTYNCSKIGFALKIDDSDKMYKGSYQLGRDIHSWESMFWVHKIDNPDYELYSADIDTTFYLHNKHGNGSRIRIAGNFTARHLPFYINDGVLTNTDKYNMYNSSKFSTIKPLFFNYYN